MYNWPSLFLAKNTPMLRVQKVPTSRVSLKLLKISIFLRTNSMGDLNCVIKSTVGRTLDLIDQKVKKESATAVLLIFYSNWQSKHRIWSIDFLFVSFPSGNPTLSNILSPKMEWTNNWKYHQKIPFPPTHPNHIKHYSTYIDHRSTLKLWFNKKWLKIAVVAVAVAATTSIKKQTND